MSLAHGFRVIYYSSDANLIQYMEDCAIFDPQLIYRLKPGVCRFSNREFSTEVRVNSVGLRDDEFSLTAPEGCCLG